MAPGLCLAAALVGPAAPADAQWSLWRGESAALEVGGYVRSLSAVQDLGYDLPAGERRTAFNGEVVRLKWLLRGDGWRVEAHDRLQLRVTSAGAAAAPGSGGSVVGFGVSAVPDRSVDLETDLVTEEGLRLWHDVDRLALTVYSDVADVTVGRQAITWGLSSLFPVADLWARFSPFELDTEEKPGIDAVRALAYPGSGVEVDAVIADRGSLDDLSAGVRASWSLPAADVYGGVGKFWRQVIVLVGGTYLLDELKLRAEAAVPFDLDGDGAERLRATVGADWIRGDWLMSGELHLNGIGRTDPSEYTAVLADERFGRGETYYLGRAMAGALASWSATDRLAVSVTSLVNLHDPSTSWTPVVSYDFGQNSRFAAGGLLSFGDTPDFGPAGVPSLRSEFGAYGSLGWTQLSIYF